MLIDVATVCSGCGKPTKEAVKGRCPDCATVRAHETAARELDRTRARAESEPWSRLYSRAVWRRCRAFVLERDGYRCTLRISPRCKPNGPRLRAHHSPTPTREMWTRARGHWDLFVELACNPDGVVTVCEPCHNLDDARRRRVS